MGLTCDALPAHKAEALGLVDAVCATLPEAEAALRAAAARLARRQPALLAAAKRLPAGSIDEGLLAGAMVTADARSREAAVLGRGDAVVVTFPQPRVAVLELNMPTTGEPQGPHRRADGQANGSCTPSARPRVSRTDTCGPQPRNS
jgi:hypothetical protein